MHLIYDVCDTYMEHDEGLGLGNYALDSPDFPLPHPFCRCTWYYDTDRTLEEIGGEIGRWIGGEDNGKLEKAFGEWEKETINAHSAPTKKYNTSGNMAPPMDKDRYMRMSLGLERLGVRCLPALDGDELRYLELFGAEAIMEWPNQILHQRKVPSASALFEEIIHWYQYKKYGEDYCRTNRIWCEAQANRKLLQHGKAYGFSEKDFEDIRRNLKLYEDILRKEGIDIGEIPEI